MLEGGDRDPAGRGPDRGPQRGQRPLGVVTGGRAVGTERGLVHDRLALGLEAGQEEGPLHLGAGNGGPVLDPPEAAPDHLDRRMPALGVDLGPHEAERLGHPLHRAEGEALVPLEDAGERAARQRAR